MRCTLDSQASLLGEWMELWQEAGKAHLTTPVVETNSVAATVPPPLLEEEVEKEKGCDLSPDEDRKRQHMMQKSMLRLFSKESQTRLGVWNAQTIC